MEDSLDFNQVKQKIARGLEQLKKNAASLSVKDADLIDKFIEQSLSYGFTELLVESIILKSTYLANIDKYDEAISVIEQALAIAQKYESNYLLGLSYNRAGAIHFNYCLYELAIDNFLKAVDFLQKSNDNLQTCYAMRNIGVSYLRKNEDIKAYEYLHKALQFSEDNKLREAKASILSWLGILGNEQENYDKAVEYLIESNNIFLEFENYFDYAVNLNIIAVSYIYKQPHLAVEYLLEAEEIAKKYNYVFVLADISHNLGLAHGEQNKHEQALTHYFESLEYRKSAMINDKLSNTLHNIGNIYNTLNKKDLALEYLYKGLEIREKVNYRFKIAESYISLSNAYMTHHDYDEAFKACNKALEYAVEFNDSLQLSTIYNTYCDYYDKIGNFKKAHEFFTLYCAEYDKMNVEKTQKSLQLMRKKLNLNSIERNAKIKVQEEALKGEIAMAVTANHYINQPLMVLQGNLDLINAKLYSADHDFNKKERNKVQELIDKIDKTLIVFRKMVEI